MRVVLSRMTEYYIQFVKAVLVLNAGAIVAVLGFMQALASKNPPTILHMLKPYGLWATDLYLVGIALGVGGLWHHYKALSYGITNFFPSRNSPELHLRIVWWWFEIWDLGPVLGGVAFVVASIIVLRGVAISL